MSSSLLALPCSFAAFAMRLTSSFCSLFLFTSILFFSCATKADLWLIKTIFLACSYEALGAFGTTLASSSPSITYRTVTCIGKAAESAISRD